MFPLSSGRNYFKGFLVAVFGRWLFRLSDAVLGEEEEATTTTTTKGTGGANRVFRSVIVIIVALTSCRRSHVARSPSFRFRSASSLLSARYVLRSIGVVANKSAAGRGRAGPGDFETPGKLEETKKRQGKKIPKEGKKSGQTFTVFDVPFDAKLARWEINGATLGHVLGGTRTLFRLSAPPPLAHTEGFGDIIRGYRRRLPAIKNCSVKR